ncbi:hypothetical protein TSAR_000866 [Trichomalopsis sarcophagae]|uniref:Ionotropic glutamate receptor C-terminal domain-containing protein n=1 Tax=Trichomalopsis sarcophagae TaxID=543379 RepID=A0A232EPI0_9HYME|nr:hypothetical protein TSAR_000866 [Trichomalopsis sarcophagae]
MEFIDLKTVLRLSYTLITFLVIPAVSLDGLNWIDHVVDSMVNDMNVQHTTIITPSPNEISPVSSSFNSHILDLMKHVKLVSALKIRAGSKPNILIFFINGNYKFDVQRFFKEMWSTVYYLYITIIEVMDQARSSKQLSTSRCKTQMNISVHQHNPFNDSYEVAPWSENSKLYNEKLRNLHGYVLRAVQRDRHFAVIPFKYYTKNVKRDSFSQAVSNTEYTVMKTIAETLNFTMNTTIISEEPNVIAQFDNILRANFDLYVNSIQSGVLDGVPGVPYLHETTHMLIKQYGYYDIRVPWNLILATSALLVIIILTKYSLHLFRSNSEFASAYNIAMIVFGLSTPVEPQKLKEKIIYASLLIISAVFSAELLEYIINVSISRKQYYVFNTLQDVIDSGIHITMERRTHIGILESINITVIPNEHQECINLMTENDTVNACMSDIIVIDDMIEKYSKPQDGWIISKVRENLQANNVIRFMLARHSPYANDFSKMIQRLVESGIPIYWLKSAVRMLALKNNDTIDSRSSFADINIDENQINDYFNDERPLAVRLIYVLVVGHVLSTLIFMIETVTQKLRNQKHKKLCSRALEKKEKLEFTEQEKERAKTLLRVDGEPSPTYTKRKISSDTLDGRRCHFADIDIIPDALHTNAAQPNGNVDVREGKKRLCWNYRVMEMPVGSIIDVTRNFRNYHQAGDTLAKFDDDLWEIKAKKPDPIQERNIKKVSRNLREVAADAMMTFLPTPRPLIRIAWGCIEYLVTGADENL